MQTDVLHVSPAELRQGETCSSGRPHSPHPAIARAVQLLTAGEVVAIPTETVYGLAANALSASAVGRVFAAKNRPPDNPLIIHISSLDMLASLYPPDWSLPPIYHNVVRDLWPGPLTLLLPRSPLVPDAVTCGLPTMAVRMPSHPVALSLIAACGFPLAAPSANSSGRPSPTLARHVLSDLGTRIPLILDGGPCTCGVESTVLDGLRTPPAVLRPGGVTREQLEAYPGLEGLQQYARDFRDAALEATPTTPGMKYRHYSPVAPVLLVDPGDPAVEEVGDEELAGRLRRGVETLLAELLWSAAAARAGGVVAGAVPAAGTGRALLDGPLPCGEGLRQQQPAGANRERHQQQGQGIGKQQRPVVGVLRTSLLNLPPGPRPPQSHPDCVAGARDGTAGSSAAPVVAVAQPPFASEDQAGPEAGAPAPLEYVLGHVSRPADVAAELFAALRHLDELGVGTIVVEGVRDSGAGSAVMNRLRKAASRVVRV